MKTIRLTPYNQAIYETNRYSVPADRARQTVTSKAYPFQMEIWDDKQLLATHPCCYGREQDIFDPLHYLSLLEQRPGVFEYTKPLKQWRVEWQASYHQLLANLQKKWPEGRGVQKFICILQLHQHYEAALVEQAIEQALSYGCAHLDGVQYRLHQLIAAADPPEQVATGWLDLGDRPDMDAIGNYLVDLSRYEQLSKLLW